MNEYVNVFHVSENQEKFQLIYKDKTVKNNRVYISFDISDNKQGTFTIRIYNPVGSGVTVAVDLLSGGYRVLNLNQHSMDMVKPKEKKIFEAHGEKDQFLFFDMKMCFGEVKVRFLQSDGQEVNKDETKAKTIMDNNTFLHYLKINKRNIFLEVENLSDKKPAYFDLLSYLEKSVSKDPSSEVVQEGDGKVMFETDS